MVLRTHAIRNAFTLPEEKGPCVESPNSGPHTTQGLHEESLPGPDHTPFESLLLPHTPDMCTSQCKQTPGILGTHRSPCFSKRIDPTIAGSFHTLLHSLRQTNLSTGALPLVGGHDQVSDHKEDIISLRNHRGDKGLLQPS